MRKKNWFAGGCFVLALAAAQPAVASPWAEVGDAQLRSDIEILAAANVIDGITTQWPLPWASIVTRLRMSDAVDGQPAMVRDAAARVLQQAQAQMRIGSVRFQATVDGTNAPSVVRGFDGLGRETAVEQLSAEYMGSTTALRVSIGAETRDHTGRTSIDPDGSYFAQKIGGAVVYAGYVNALVGAWLDLGHVAVEQRAAVSPDRNRARSHGRIRQPVAVLDRSLADGVSRRLARR